MYGSLPEYALYSMIDGSKVDMLRHDIPDPSMVSLSIFKPLNAAKNGDMIF